MAKCDLAARSAIREPHVINVWSETSMVTESPYNTPRFLSHWGLQ